MKTKVLIADKLIKQFDDIYKKYFIVDYLWQVKNKKLLSEYEALIVSGGFNTNNIFLKILQN